MIDFDNQVTIITDNNLLAKGGTHHMMTCINTFRRTDLISILNGASMLRALR